MSVIGSNLIAGASGQGGGYNLTNSLRFRSSASASLTRTPATSGLNQTKTTLSVWVKRGVLGGTQQIYGARTGANATYTLFYFQDDGLRFLDSQGASLITTPVFRDPSAWYHLVLSIDTTQATASNRVKIYVNGVQITAFSTATYPTQNAVLAINYFNIAQNIGQQASSQYFDGYMAEFHDIDGQALTPSSFGETSATTGVWQPIRYAGTYGTNGFYLPFTDNSALTTSSNAGLGKDFSGNANYWTTNNISITAGATYDSMTDVPTLTSATTANYAVLNPLDVISASNTRTISNGNLSVSISGTWNGGATIGVTSGKFYCEYTLTASVDSFIGIDNGSASVATAYRSDGTRFNGSTFVSYGASYTTNDVIGMAFDATSNTIEYFKNNTSQGLITGVTYGSLVRPFFYGASGAAFNINFGQRPFAYTPPTGFVALNTFNLPTPTVGASASTLANKNMDATTFTGTGASQSIANSGSMQPDFVWAKSRGSAQDHWLADSIRGANNILYSNLTNAETVGAGVISAFNSNGFSVTNAFTNAVAYVGWQWKGGGAAVTNTAGSITSQVSANTSAGFSVVTYTGTGANATVGHGLGVAPKMVIVKRRDSGPSSWTVWHTNFSSIEYIYLNLTNAVSSSSGSTVWNSTVPSSSVISLGTYTDVNASGGTHVAYCFAPVAGYSAFGSYTGNGSADGPFVFTGFRPEFLMIKASSAAGYSWTMEDAARSPFNASDKFLFANLSNAENSGTARSDFLSNGFKIRDSSNNNDNGVTYIYMAFAESPFKYANAR